MDGSIISIKKISVLLYSLLSLQYDCNSSKQHPQYFLHVHILSLLHGHIRTVHTIHPHDMYQSTRIQRVLHYGTL